MLNTCMLFPTVCCHGLFLHTVTYFSSKFYMIMPFIIHTQLISTFSTFWKIAVNWTLPIINLFSENKCKSKECWVFVILNTHWFSLSPKSIIKTLYPLFQSEMALSQITVMLFFKRSKSNQPCPCSLISIRLMNNQSLCTIYSQICVSCLLSAWDKDIFLYSQLAYEKSHCTHYSVFSGYTPL